MWKPEGFPLGSEFAVIRADLPPTGKTMMLIKVCIKCKGCYLELKQKSLLVQLGDAPPIPTGM